MNIGLGIQQKRIQKPMSALLKDWLATDDRFKEMTPLSDDSNLTGSWQVSVRHQNDCLVANGYMICGDTAWFPNPISAGGIGPRSEEHTSELQCQISYAVFCLKKKKKIHRVCLSRRAHTKMQLDDQHALAQNPPHNHYTMAATQSPTHP